MRLVSVNIKTYNTTRAEKVVTKPSSTVDPKEKPLQITNLYPIEHSVKFRQIVQDFFPTY